MLSDPLGDTEVSINVSVAQRAAGAFQDHVKMAGSAPRSVILTPAHALMGIAEMNAKQV